ncbi:MAG: serpin family protein [Prolixibacteraceae bacterium]|nr:serpin family protein [Prolixibacteraceae bacterium]MBN2649872.1 serpin family protein [Prolixibacteraceae bacterium]
MKTQALFLSILFVLLTAASCDKEEDALPKEIDISLKSQQIVEADNAFGLDIFQRILSNETEENFMISPLSISMALSMAYNGAETDTKAEMAEALGVNEFTRDELNETYRDLIAALVEADPQVAMQIANSIWYRDTYHVEQSFLDVNHEYYDAEVNEADFDAPETLDNINNWVNDKTNGKIQKIINDIPAEMVMYLINAIYFKGSWTKEFNPESTQPMNFKTSEGEFVEAELMGRVDTLDYQKNDTFSAIRMPYGKGNFSMTVFLPNNGKSVDDVAAEFNPENWENWQEGFTETQNVDIRLPKFKVEYEKTLNSILQDMGMNKAFTAQADFSNINPARDLFISFVKHKTFIEVDEEGTEAAAVTIIGFETTSIDPNEPKTIYFHCTKPFLYAITEKDTGAILFMGKVGNPAVE